MGRQFNLFDLSKLCRIFDMLQNWKHTALGQWVDNKINELSWPHTAVLLGDWEQHEYNIKTMRENFIVCFWFLNSSSPYALDTVPFYFVPLPNNDEAHRLIKVFKEDLRFFYMRIYDKNTATHAIVHKHSRDPKDVYKT